MKVKYLVCGLTLASLSMSSFSDELAESICGNIDGGWPKTECLMSERQKAISSLNGAVNKAVAGIKATDYLPQIQRKKYIETLKKSQKLWQMYVKLQCNDMIEYEFWGASSGSSSGNTMLSCEVSKILQRINEMPVFPD